MLAIWAAGASGVKEATRSAKGNRMQRIVKSTVPMMLNIRWMIVARLALRLVPMEAKTAVIQVPMFCPKRTYTALSRPITPLRASAKEDEHRTGKADGTAGGQSLKDAH